MIRVCTTISSVVLGALVACGGPASPGPGGTGIDGGAPSADGRGASSDGRTPDGGAGAGDAGASNAIVSLTFTGCSPDYSQHLVVATNSDSMAVSTTTAPLSSIQLSLTEMSGTVQLSTQERVATGDVINLVTGGTTWTNVSTSTPDSISGSIVIHDYRQSEGIADIDFDAVVLANVQSEAPCTIDGNLTTTGTSF
jgi:hypothetical protein